MIGSDYLLPATLAALPFSRVSPADLRRVRLAGIEGSMRDISTILTSILMHSGVGIRKDADCRDHLRHIQAAARAATSLLNRVLESLPASDPSGKTELNALARELMPVVLLTTTPTQSVEYALDPNLPACRGENAEIREVFLGLALAARDVLDNEAGTLTIRTATRDEQGVHCRVEVEIAVRHEGAPRPVAMPGSLEFAGIRRIAERLGGGSETRTDTDGTLHFRVWLPSADGE